MSTDRVGQGISEHLCRQRIERPDGLEVLRSEFAGSEPAGVVVARPFGQDVDQTDAGQSMPFTETDGTDHGIPARQRRSIWTPEHRDGRLLPHAFFTRLSTARTCRSIRAVLGSFSGCTMDLSLRNFPAQAQRFRLKWERTDWPDYWWGPCDGLRALTAYPQADARMMEILMRTRCRRRRP